MAPLRCVYCDLDGTLVGRGGSLVHDGDGEVTMLGFRVVEACLRAGVELVLFSGRRKAQVSEDSRLLGQRAYIYEAGAALVMDGEEEWLTDGLVPREGVSIHDQITASGAPQLLLETLRRAAGVPRAVAPGPRGLPPLPRRGGRLRGRRAARHSRPRRPAAGRQRRDPPAHARPRARPRLPPGPALGLQGARGRPPHAGARAGARGVHRGRRLARGPRRRPGGRRVLARGQRAREGPDADRGAGGSSATSAWRRSATAPASTRPCSPSWPSAAEAAQPGRRPNQASPSAPPATSRSSAPPATTAVISSCSGFEDSRVPRFA